jgi:hypothetical protein
MNGKASIMVSVEQKDTLGNEDRCSTLFKVERRTKVRGQPFLSASIFPSLEKVHSRCSRGQKENAMREVSGYKCSKNVCLLTERLMS